MFPISLKNRMKVSNVKRNLVPNAWTTDKEDTLPELSLCTVLMTITVSVAEEQSWRRPMNGF